MKKSSAIRTFITYLLLIILAMYAITMMSAEQIKDMSYTEMMQKIEEKAVTSIELQNDRLTANVKLKNEQNIQRVVKLPNISTFTDSIQDRVVAGEF